MEPGVYDNIPADDYHGGDGINVSTLKMLAEEGGPARVRWGSPKESKALQFGSLIHVAVLEPQNLARAYHPVALDRFDSRSKGYHEAEIQAAGREIVRASDYEAAQRIRDAVMSHPVARDMLAPGYSEYTAAMRESVRMPFNDWIVSNQVVFTAPYDRAGAEIFWPRYTVLHALPENLKCQFHYLRPDLGTEVFRYDESYRLARELDVMPERQHNRTTISEPPELTPEAKAHVRRVFRWDLQAAPACNCPADRCFAEERNDIGQTSRHTCGRCP